LYQEKCGNTSIKIAAQSEHVFVANGTRVCVLFAFFSDPRLPTMEIMSALKA
jgi:hypothetical protein